MPGRLPGYRHGWLRSDVVAGMTAAPVIIPAAMANVQSEKVIGDQWRATGGHSNDLEENR